MNWRIFAFLLVAVSSMGCATLFGSHKTMVAMQSTPAEADVWVDGANMGKTPVSLELSNKKPHTVIFKREGYQDATYQVDTKLGAGWVILDVLGGVIPVVIDAASGAWHGLDTRTVNQTLQPAVSSAGQ